MKLISWVEIPAIDFNRAVAFYSAILKIKLEGTDYGSEKMACFPGGEGAISQSPGFLPGKQGVLVSLNTGDDLQGTIDRIRENSGEIVQDITPIEAEGRGSFAIFIDCEGNKIGLYGEN